MSFDFINDDEHGFLATEEDEWNVTYYDDQKHDPQNIGLPVASVQSLGAALISYIIEN